MNALDVLEGRERWAVDCGDCIEWLKSLPDDSVDLLFTSPPYELARTYGLGERMVGGQAWVDWMVEVVRAASPKVKGLIAVNCEGQTRNYKYSCAPFLLIADLHRAGFNLRKPCVFHRSGIPGSGGPDWLRNDWEPVVCVTREGKLPWSDNTACGHPAKYAPGGEMSYRRPNGARKNSIGIDTGRAIGARAYGDKGGNRGEAYRAPQTAPDTPPELANPGNVLYIPVGGGLMGHDLAHENEAPFPLELPAFFVQSFCPPGGVVADPFCGSGSTLHAALNHGRRSIGCDLRQSQVELTRRRLRGVTPSMFSESA